MLNRNLKKSIVFVFLAFLFSWGNYAVLYFIGKGWPKDISTALMIVYMFGPLFSAFIVQKFIFGEDFVNPLGISFKLNGWFVAAVLLPILIALGAFGISLFFNNVYYTPDMSGLIERTHGTISSYQFKRLREFMAISSIHPIWKEILKAIIAGGSVFAFIAFGGEVGWRGFLYKEIGYFGFWKSNIVIGIIWALWSIPLILIWKFHPQHPGEGIFMVMGFFILISPILSYIRIKAKSVAAPSIICGIIYFCQDSNMAIMFVSGGNDLTVGMTGLAGFIVLAVLNIILFIYNNLVLKMQYRVL